MFPTSAITFFSEIPWFLSLAVIAFLLLVTGLLALLGYEIFVRLPLSILRGEHSVDNRRQGWTYFGMGSATLITATLVTWLAYLFQITLLGGSSQLVAAGAFAVGFYWLMYGAGILLFRTGALGVLMFIYAFLFGCIYLIVNRR